jgi:hypothetical protein
VALPKVVVTHGCLHILIVPRYPQLQTRNWRDIAFLLSNAPVNFVELMGSNWKLTGLRYASNITMDLTSTLVQLYRQFSFIWHVDHSEVIIQWQAFLSFYRYSQAEQTPWNNACSRRGGQCSISPPSPGARAVSEVPPCRKSNSRFLFRKLYISVIDLLRNHSFFQCNCLRKSILLYAGVTGFTDEEINRLSDVKGWYFYFHSIDWSTGIIVYNTWFTLNFFRHKQIQIT